tara:strand:+ start:1953 stop:2414 length:462 start_codon:yes stop_codon:yes gene_type:complete
MILKKNINMYDIDDGYDKPINQLDLENRLVCTFSTLDEVDLLVNNIRSTYNIKYNKMFILHVQSSDEYAVTYNVEQGNVNELPENTILVHRKKDSNTLYTINALNELIKNLNGGVVDTKFPIEWQHYRNTILLTQHSELKQLKTKIYKIIDLN